MQNNSTSTSCTTSFFSGLAECFAAVPGCSAAGHLGRAQGNTVPFDRRASSASAARSRALAFFPRNQGGGVLAPRLTGLCAQIWLTFPSRGRATSRRDGSRDLDEKSSDLAKDLPNSSFRAHPVSRHCVREARNHADLYRTIWVLSGSAVCGPMRVQGGDCTDRWISARSSHRPTKLRLETFVDAQSVLPRRARGGRNHADLYRTIWVLGETTPTCTGPFGYFRVLRCADP